MSGVEVAGLALAIFPVCIDLIKATSKIFGSEYGLQVRSFERQLRMESVKFVNSLAEIYGGEITESPESGFYINTKTPDRVLDTYFTQNLQSKQPFIEAIQAMEEQLKAVEKRLGSLSVGSRKDSIGKASVTSKRISQGMKERMRLFFEIGTSGGEEMRQQISSIRNINDDINRLIQSAKGSSRSNMHSSACSPPHNQTGGYLAVKDHYSRVQESAKSIFEALKNQIQIQHECRGSRHSVGLCLEKMIGIARSDPGITPAPKEDSELTFRIMVHLSGIGTGDGISQGPKQGGGMRMSTAVSLQVWREIAIAIDGYGIPVREKIKKPPAVSRKPLADTSRSLDESIGQKASRTQLPPKSAVTSSNSRATYELGSRSGREKPLVVTTSRSQVSPKRPVTSASSRVTGTDTSEVRSRGEKAVVVTASRPQAPPEPPLITSASSRAIYRSGARLGREKTVVVTASEPNAPIVTSTKRARSGKSKSKKKKSYIDGRGYGEIVQPAPAIPPHVPVIVRDLKELGWFRKILSTMSRKFNMLKSSSQTSNLRRSNGRGSKSAISDEERRASNNPSFDHGYQTEVPYPVDGRERAKFRTITPRRVPNEIPRSRSSQRKSQTSKHPPPGQQPPLLTQELPMAPGSSSRSGSMESGNVVHIEDIESPHPPRSTKRHTAIGESVGSLSAPSMHICLSIQACNSAEKLVGGLNTGTEDSSIHYGVYSKPFGESLNLPNGSDQLANTVPVSLETLLEDPQLSKLSLRKKLLIAIKLACSVIQLHDTWLLGANWSKENIFFFPDPTTKKMLIKKPLILRDVNTFPVPSENTSCVRGDLKSNPCFLLGLVLWELWHEKCLEEEVYGVGSDFGKRKPYLQWENSELLYRSFTALQQMQQAGMAPKNYIEVVNRCLFGNLSLNSEEGIQQVWEKVIFPLEDLYRNCE